MGKRSLYDWLNKYTFPLEAKYKDGTFKEGYDFDALVIGDLQDSFMELSPKELVERFCYSGDVNNIKYRYLKGKEL